MVNVALHSVAAGDELVEVELVGLVPRDLSQGQEPRHQLGDNQAHHDAAHRRVCRQQII